MNLQMQITQFLTSNCYSTDLSSEEGGNNKPMWQNMYAGIESANTIIQNMPLYYDKENANYNTRLGEGYFLRGYFYLNAGNSVWRCAIKITNPQQLLKLILHELQKKSVLHKSLLILSLHMIYYL